MTDALQLRAPHGIWTKICGLTHTGDAAGLQGLGADAAGLNFWAPGARYLAPGEDADIAAALPASLLRIGVFVDASFEEICDRAKRLKLDAAQLHQGGTPALAARLAEVGVASLPVLRPRSSDDLAALEAWPQGPYLMDAWHPEAPGGTGRRLDAELLRAAVVRFPERPLIVAGGLTSQNVAEVIASTGAFGVDVASGVEAPRQPQARPRKDLAQVSAFIQAAQGAAAVP